MPHIFIALPAFGGTNRVELTSSLIATVPLLIQRGIEFNFTTLSYSDIVASRNFLASLALHQPGVTHLLMVDADQCFPASVILHMFDQNVPHIAAACPNKTIDFENLVALARARPDAPTDKLIALSQTYNLSIEPGRTEIQNGVISVPSVGTGLFLIQVEVLQALAKHPQVAKMNDPALRRHAVRQNMGGDTVFGFFDRIVKPDGVILSEDFSFCERVRTLLGLPIKALITENIGHIGTMMYQHPCALKIVEG